MDFMSGVLEDGCEYYIVKKKKVEEKGQSVRIVLV